MAFHRKHDIIMRPTIPVQLKAGRAVLYNTPTCPEFN